MKIRDPLTGDVRDKTVTALTPAVEQLASNPKPLETAASYNERVKVAQEALKKARTSRPVGGVDPIPPGKLSGVMEQARAANDAMPQPFFATREPPAEQTPAFAPPARPPRSVTEAATQNRAHKPMTLAQAKDAARAAQEPPKSAPGVSAETVKLLELQNQASQQAAEQAPSMKKDLDEVEEKFAANSDPRIEELFPTLDVNRDEIMSVLLDNGRRRAIESRLPRLDITDLIMKRSITQVVPVRENQLTYTLRTMSQDELLWCLQYTYEKTSLSSSAYGQTFLDTCKAVCGIVAINGAPMPDHRSGIGTMDETVDRGLFEKKMSIVKGMPWMLVADLGIQWTWFNQRVAKLFSLDTLKNG